MGRHSSILYRIEYRNESEERVTKPIARGRSPRGRSRENTRERLLEAAVDVFVEKGLKRVTVDDLVGAAGFTRGAFYSNFSSVDEVFFEVFRRNATSMIDRAREAIAAVPEDELDVEFLGTVLDSLTVPGRTGLVLQTECTLLALRDERAKELLAEFSREIRSQIVEVVDDVLARLGRRSTLPSAQVAELVIALQFHASTLRELGDPSLEADDAGAASWLSGVIVRTVLTSFSEEDGAPAG
jgi:AcrR family transcriptional regulator